MTAKEARRAAVFGGRVVWLTGAASGIGREVALQLAQAGARVHAVDMDAGNLATLEQAAPGGRIVTHVLDVADAAAYGRIIRDLYDSGERIDFLFNNAGVTLLGEAHKVPFEKWRWLLDVNVMGVVNGIAHVYPRMAEQGGGHVVNTASLAGATGYATAAAYTMSKGCILGLSLSLRAEAREHGVKVTVVCPGYVDTNIFRPERVVGATLEQVLEDLPAGMIHPREAAASLLDGVAKGRETVVFPFSSKLWWWVVSWAPAVVGPIQRRFLRAFSPTETLRRR